MARPKLDIDPDKVEMLASFGCSTIEIARLHNCDESTVRLRFKNELELVGNLENLLKECGYEDSPIEKKSIKQSEPMEDTRVLA